MNTIKHVILIEPAANLYVGHMREKLEVVTDALKEMGIEYELVTWETPSKSLLASPAVIHEIPSFMREWVKCVPSRWRTRALEFFVYLKGFRVARDRGWGIIGMTTSDPYGPLLASLLCCPGKNYLQRMFNHGLRQYKGRYICSRPRLWAYEKLMRGGGRLLLFTQLMRKQLGEFRKSLLPITLVIPEFTKLPVTDLSSPGCPVMLVSGLDNLRRTPIHHILQIKEGSGLKEIIIQYQDDGTAAELKSRLEQAVPGCTVSWIDKYFTGDEWEALFRRARITLVAYEPSFSSISAILLQSIVFGVPVLSSRFPDAEQNFAQHGQLGELFEYKNPADFNRALQKLLDWTEPDYTRFHQARNSLMESNSPRSVLREYLGPLSCSK